MLQAIVILAMPSLAFGQDAIRAFYNNKTITIILAGAAGGGGDAITRLFARHLGKQIPGNPSVIVQNAPGTGGIIAADRLYNTSPKDGTHIGALQRPTAFVPLLESRKVNYKPLEFSWLGSLSSEASLFIVWQTAPAQKFEDAYTQTILIGATGAGGDSVVYPKVLNELLNTKFKVIGGYQSTEINLAMERGEVHGRLGVPWGHVNTVLRDSLQSGRIRVLAQIAIRPIRELAGVPMILDFVKNEDDRKVLELLFARQEPGRPFALPPDVPTDRVSALRAAFMQTTKDADFLQEAEKGSFDLDVMTGEDVYQLILKLYNFDEKIVRRTREVMEAALK